MILIAEVLDLIEEVLNLLFLDFKFTVLYVKIKDLPDVIWTELWKVCNFVLGDERHVKLVDANHFKDLEDLVIVVLRLLNASLVVS